MVNSIISYLNTRLSLTNLFEYSYGICELVHEKEQVRPMQYCSNGEWKEVSNFDAFNGVSYWRKNGNVSNSIIEGNVSCAKFQNIELPLRLICVVPRTKMTDNAYTSDSIASIINTQLTESSRTLKSTLNARKVNILVSGYETDSNTILNDEYSNIQITDLSYKYAYLSISVTVTIDINVDCIVNECDDVSVCDNLLRALTTSEKLTCILPSYDFADTEVLNNLTAQQELDLIAALCDGCDAVTIYLSNGSTVVTTVASGGSYTIAKHTIYLSNGVTVYANPEFNVNTTLQNVAITDGISGNTTKEVGETYTCGLISAATCTQLNAQLTQSQLNTINEINPLKTGQTTSYRTGDDGDLEKGRLTSFLVLPCNNPFGNTNRFTNSIGGSVYDGSDGSLSTYAIDHATGLGWYLTAQALSTWNNAIDGAEAFATHFSDWRLPNLHEYRSIENYSLTQVRNYVPFSMVVSPMWSSTTNANTTTAAWSMNGVGTNQSVAKTTTEQYLMCRNHY